jgi:hypothetical protein
MPKRLEKEFRYYLENQDELVSKYKGKFIVIKNRKVIGEFNSEIDAIRETSKVHELGTFLVQKCESGEAGHTETYQSRVIFG